MLILISQIIFALSVLGILFLIFRRIPDLLEFPRSDSEKALVYETIRGYWKKLKQKAEASGFLHDAVIPKTEKVLRKTKIILLKLDNFLAKRVDKLRQKMKKRKKETEENNNLPE